MVSLESGRMTAGRQVTGEDDGDEVEEESGGATAEQKQENRRDDGDSDCDGSGRGLKDGANAISSPLRVMWLRTKTLAY
ncbi:hypothetical protein E3N88_14051 [Mikania micrantha]|uniref:Uncharacterized protein n=1 Tax=Mikania micrantha TaxID=192012 RepID=A0A5N6P222_9ASTR|nr:hypothetical protein E3N88_14051 [Mikania micrantha]